MVSAAVQAIDGGMAEVVLVTSADNPRSGTRAAYEKPYGEGADYGWSGVAPGYALIARRFLHERAATEEDLGRVAMACRRHGAQNPDAQLRRPIALHEHGQSPWLYEPLRRDDCALVSDGAAAVVVMSAARAAETAVPHPVPILGFGQGHTSWDVAQRPDITRTLGAESARGAFAMAGVTPAHVDVAQLYDCFTITPLVALEEYGFCERGEVSAFLADGNIEIGGRLPLNTSGGLLSETGMPGMQLVLEGVRQVRGTSTNQVPGAAIAAVSGQGGIMHTHATLLLGG